MTTGLAFSTILHPEGTTLLEVRYWNNWDSEMAGGSWLFAIPKGWTDAEFRHHVAVRARKVQLDEPVDWHTLLQNDEVLHPEVVWIPLPGLLYHDTVEGAEILYNPWIDEEDEDVL